MDKPNNYHTRIKLCMENISREEYHYIQYHYIESTIYTHVYTIMANCSYIKYLSLKMDEMMQSINFLLKEIENVEEENALLETSIADIKNKMELLRLRETQLNILDNDHDLDIVTLLQSLQSAEVELHSLKQLKAQMEADEILYPPSSI